MPKRPITHLDCQEVFRDGFIEVRESGQFNTENHFHNLTQLITPTKGMLYLYSQNGSYCVPTNHYIYVEAYVHHKLISRSPNLKLKTIFLNIHKKEHPIGNGKNIQIFAPSPLIDNFIDFGLNYWDNMTNNNVKKSGLKSLKYMLPHLLKKPIDLHIVVPKSEKLLQLINYIVNSLNESLTIDLMSSKVNLSKRTLFRQFKQETGITLFQFIKLIRIHKAIELMENTSLSISEIVYMIGYESPATFSNTFKQLIGLSPQKYRQYINQ